MLGLNRKLILKHWQRLRLRVNLPNAWNYSSLVNMRYGGTKGEEDGEKTCSGIHVKGKVALSARLRKRQGNLVRDCRKEAWLNYHKSFVEKDCRLSVCDNRAYFDAIKWTEKGLPWRCKVKLERISESWKQDQMNGSWGCLQESRLPASNEIARFSPAERNNKHFERNGLYRGYKHNSFWKMHLFGNWTEFLLL